jgi:hypothetical protein
MGVVAVLLVLSVAGCTFNTGARVGAGVARSTNPMTLPSPIGEAPTMADASNSQEWMELELQGDVKYVRGIFVLGGGNSHTRFRNSPTGPIFAKDDNFHARAGGGLGLVSPAFKGFRVAPYFIYNSNFGGQYNAASVTKEYGVDIEWLTAPGKRIGQVFVVGAALITETGTASAELGGIGTHDGGFEVEGAMITFGWHLALDFTKEDD